MGGRADAWASEAANAALARIVNMLVRVVTVVVAFVTVVVELALRKRGKPRGIVSRKNKIGVVVNRASTV